MALYEGVPSVRLEGDLTRALALIPEGKLLLSKAQAVASRAEVPTFSMSRSVNADEYIYVLVAGGQNIISISAGATSVDRVDITPPESVGATYPDFLSGVVANGSMSEVEETLPDGSTRRYSVLASWTPTADCARNLDLATGRQSSERLAVRPGPNFDELRAPSTSATEYSQLRVPRASQWSGTMKKVVQLVMGLGRISTSKLRDPAAVTETTGYMKEVEKYGVQIRFDYKFMRSHGIHVAADGRLWLIEISAGRGVLATPLPIFPGSSTAAFAAKAAARNDESMVTALRELRCLPTGEGFPTDPATMAAKKESGEVLQLLSPQDLSDFYGRLSGFSSVCGWAFSDSGHEAHNVGYGYDEDETDPYQHSYWYQISIKIGATKTSREYGEPLADASATLSLQLEGALYSSKAEKGFLPVKYHEPLLYPPGLLSHSAPARSSSANGVDCNSPVYVAVVQGALKVARYYRPANSSVVTITEDDRVGEPCLFAGSWSWKVESGLRAVPAMPYTNDIDHRATLTASVSEGTMTSVPSGFGGAFGTLFITNPQYALIRRARFFRNHTVYSNKTGESRTACFASPGYLREGYYYFDGLWYVGHSGGEGVQYTSLIDPNQGVSWANTPGSGPGGGEGPRADGGCGANNCGGRHEDPRIMCVFYADSDGCSDLADSGQWLSQCQSSYAFKGSGDRGPGWGTSWDNGRDFSGHWNFMGDSYMRTDTATEAAHLYAMQPSPDPETGTVQQLYAQRSALGADCTVYYKGFSGGVGVDGVLPDDNASLGTFIGVNGP